MTRRPAPLPFPIPDDHRLLAAALGDTRDAGEALRRARDELAAEAVGHRLGPALYLRGRRAGWTAEELEPWHRPFVATAAHRLLLAEARRRTGEVLAEAGVAWLPFKGCDVGERAYAHPEERPTSDLDILVSRGAYPTARAALEARGWRSLHPRLRSQRLVADEGYCWQAVDGRGLLLEVHFQLWGMCPEDLAAAVLERAAPAPELGDTARRPRLADAFLLAAVHAWMDPPPRRLLAWWDLERLAAAGGEALAAAAARGAVEAGLRLPVGLAAAYAAALWQDGACAAVAAELLADLGAAERRVLERARRRGIDAVSLGALHLARLLARRPCRKGWSAAWRRLWPHPGVVEQETPPGWSWPRRRLVHLVRRSRP